MRSVPSPLFSDLLSRLDADPDSAVVVSLAAVRSQGGTWSLSQGSVLLGPARMAALSWLEWRAENGERWAQEHQRRLTGAGMDLSRYSNFADVEGDWLLARFALDGPGSPAERAGRWMEQLTGPGVTVTDGVGGQHTVHAEVAPADALVLASRGGGSLYYLTQGAARPVHGYRFPLSAPNDALPKSPQAWPHGAGGVQMPLSVLTGFSAGDGKTQGGVAVARLRRTAWISGLRADSTVEVSITLDSGRTSAASLEVDLEEIGADGLLQARRVRLGDLALPSHTAERLTVVLPTLGSGLQRRLRLYDHGGRLLDYVDASHFLERIVVQIVTPEGAAATTTIGAVTKPRDAVTRLSALNVAEEEYTRLLEEGLAHRIADDPDTARTVLKGMLAQARGELWVLDPYFGHTTDDWDVLQQVAVPVRVLTAHRRNHGVATAAPAPAADLYARLPALRVRSWDMSVDRTPWHDRFYIWEGGGLSVGTSPNGLGRRQARIGHISPTEAAAWGLRFTHWWDHSAAVVVL